MSGIPLENIYKYWLKFDSQAHATDVLNEFYDVQAGQFFSTKTTAVLDIGEYQRDTGETITDSEGYEQPVMELVPGYHVNIESRVEMPELNAFDMKPKTPGIDWS